MKYLFLHISLLLCFSLQAQAGTPLTLHYAVYGGGIHAVNASLMLNETKNTYRAVVKAQTQGFLGDIAPWSTTLTSSGVKQSKQWQPKKTISATVWRDEAKITEMHYDGKGRILKRVMKEKGHADDTKPADPALVKGATDLPTGILNFLRHRDMNKGCAGQFNVYDGRRRYMVTLANQRAETLKATRYNIFSGAALSCTLEVKPDGGDWAGKKRGWYKIQEDSRHKGGLPRVMVARLDGIADWLVPVRLNLNTPWGLFVMHLTAAQAPVN